MYHSENDWCLFSNEEKYDQILIILKPSQLTFVLHFGNISEGRVCSMIKFLLNFILEYLEAYLLLAAEVLHVISLMIKVFTNFHIMAEFCFDMSAIMRPCLVYASILS